ncbi:MAG: hypothetical protein FJ096_04095 [Deltaproteobacteria bacterium]|nr:hypothetical protein [Deltaproteobacteria bacterium]
MRLRRFAALVTRLVLLAMVSQWIDGSQSLAQEFLPVHLLARVAVLDLEFERAASILKGAGDGPDAVVERARLALYRGDCDGAVSLLDRTDLKEHDEAAELQPIAEGCARATAATLIRTDPRGVVVRFQDSSDVALFPIVADAALEIREVLARELGSRLPDPIFIDMVRDQLSLAALSGLPEKAAKTTGTVAVAKWGRVLILSPRAAPHGYGWLDTLAHEMTHLVLSQATRDRAPLWLQEGVAKREEIRWRARHPFDGLPSSDDVARAGIARGLGLPLTGLGPSIAMLPSAEQAMVAFAEVSSFVAYWVGEAGPDALPKLLRSMRDAPPGAKPDDAILAVTGTSLDDWDRRWRAWLESRPLVVPEEMQGGHELPKGRVASFREVARRKRITELLLGRGHAKAARLVVGKASELVPTDASLRCLHVDALLGDGKQDVAPLLVASPKDIRAATPRWWSLHDRFKPAEPLPGARFLAIAGDPFEPRVACEELPDGEFPADAIRRELCIAARRRPWE